MANKSSPSAGGNPPAGSVTNPLHIIGTIEQASKPPGPKPQKNLRTFVGTLIVFGILLLAIIELLIHQQFFGVIALTLLTFSILVFLGYTYHPYSWTGFGQFKGSEDHDHQPKMLWDWLTLLIIPIMLAAGAIGLGAFQNQENVNLNKDQIYLAATQYADAQQIALENTFQTYLDRMTDLLTNQHVHDDTPQGKDIRSLATARTLTILPDLSKARKASVLKFLHDAGLITRPTQDQQKPDIINPVVNLDGADFSGVVFPKDFRLNGANLPSVNFNGATLDGADLSSAYLVNANLSNAQLKGAIMCFAPMGGNTNLRGADLSGALLSGADLTGADLSGATLVGTNLGNNDPTCHALQPPNQTLPGATLTNAHLNGANLSNADLSGANVTNTDFTHVIWNKTICSGGSTSESHNPHTCAGY